MTTEEIAAAVCEKQGFLIVGANKPRPIGTVIPNPLSGLTPRGRIQVAMIVVGEGTLQEYDDQAKLARKIGNVPNERNLEFAYYLKCVPGD